MAIGRGNTHGNKSRKNLMREKAARWGEGSRGKSRVVAGEKAGYQLTERGWVVTVASEHGISTHGFICETLKHVKSVTDITDSRACGVVMSRNDSNAKRISECQNVNIVIECSMESRIAVVTISVDNVSLSDILNDGTMYVNRLQITQTVLVGFCCRLTRAEKYCGYTVSVIMLNEY
jgi:hypothetical protein